MKKRVTVQIVSFNSKEDIEECLKTVMGQTYPYIEMIVVDNNSQDNTAELVAKKYPDVRLIRNDSNIGFCGGHNIAFKEGLGEYVVVLNPDVVLDKNFIEIVVQHMNNNREVGIITGKVLKMNPDFSKTNKIDSTGIMLPRNRRPYDRGQGEEDKGQYDNCKEVFGACGAAAVYRRAMLEDIKIDDEYFDNSFFAYKEDVDLSWRARLLGWKCRYIPEAIAYHKRGWKKEGREKIPVFLKVHSIKNRYLMRIKNEKGFDFIKSLPYSIGFDISIFMYCLLKEPKTLKYIPSTLKLLSSTIKKRRKTMRRLSRGLIHHHRQL